MTIKWQNAHRNFNNFKSKHSNWLQVETVFDHLDTEADIVLSQKSSTSGCPRLSYEEKSLRSKRGEAAHLSKETQQHDPKLIVNVASISARQKGDNDLAAVLKEVNRSPSRPSKIRKMLFTSKKKPVACTAEEALEFIFENNLSKQQYLSMFSDMVQNLETTIYILLTKKYYNANTNAEFRN